MNELSARVLAYINKKTTEKFSGGIKMGFEAGKPVSFSETTNTEFKSEGAELAYNTAIENACSPNYYGTLFFLFTDGVVTHFYHTQTWQGRVLDDMLGLTAEKRRLVIRT